MKVFISTKGDSLDSEVDLRFARAKHFLLVDSENLTILDSIENKSLNEQHGVGPKTAGLALNLGAEACISGSFGSNAYSVLKEGNIALYTTPQQSVRDALTAFKKGELQVFEGE